MLIKINTEIFVYLNIHGLRSIYSFQVAQPWMSTINQLLDRLTSGDSLFTGRVVTSGWSFPLQLQLVLSGGMTLLAPQLVGSAWCATQAICIDFTKGKASIFFGYASESTPWDFLLAIRRVGCRIAMLYQYSLGLQLPIE